MGKRISDMRLAASRSDAGEDYKVAGWAPVAEGVKGEPVWDVIAQYLRAKKTSRRRS
jgi:sulfur-oxidizing protein SoxB